MTMEGVEDLGFVPERLNGRLTIPRILELRQVHGMYGRFDGTSRIRQPELASRIAWNPTRLQNTILSVGPGTPASVMMVKPSLSSSSSEMDEGNDDDAEEEDEDEDDDDDAEEEDDEVMPDDGTGELGHARESETAGNDIGDRQQWLLRTQHEQESVGPSLELAERVLMEWMDAEDNEEEEEESVASFTNQARNFAPAMRHGGCINTATWLTSPWRLSLAGHDEVQVTESYECPTQLLTSGDDRTVKFWDVRHAMGTANPLPGGRNTVLPFASDIPLGPPVEEWKAYHDASFVMSGSVIPLATLQTRHRGNVFHVTALDHKPGKVATCAADGYLRVSDLESSSSTIIVSPEFDRDDQDMLSAAGGFFALRASMCFSFHFVDENTGLLCSERGLRRFDLRLSPREQISRSILGSSGTCKACAIWSADSVDSAYVFAGGASADVSLFDLRMMTDRSTCKVVQKYRPCGLPPNSTVSVSGIDVSKDQRELLVSYENDQIYTFPIFPGAHSGAGPSVDEVTEAAKEYENKGNIQRELGAYGGHLNRYTFLKNAKYAGPQDEYICTGSDSGHAWIYEKSTGAVVSFLNADHSTCNGVVPHPSLPLFITYGIDSTAKLWRATTPVDHRTDDSPLGRARFHHKREYEKSPLVSSWSYVEEKLLDLTELEEESLSVLPDEIPTNDHIGDGGIFSGLSSIFFRSRRGSSNRGGGPFVGNDMRNLPEVLRRNLFACVQAKEAGDDEPIRGDLDDLRRRVSLIRLRHQADQQGLLMNISIPWLLRPRGKYIDEDLVVHSNHQYGDPVDLVPRFPCDWLPYDPDLTRSPRSCGPNFNLVDYDDFYQARYGNEEAPANQQLHAEPFLSRAPQKSCPPRHYGSPTSNDGQGRSDSKQALEILHETVLMLKEAGNKDLKAGSPFSAARRYDQALQYCAAAFMKFPQGSEEFVFSSGMGDSYLSWSPLLKLLAAIRLNLAMVLLRPCVNEPKRSADQAMMALLELGPFCTERGKVKKGKELDVVHKEDEPVSTFEEAKEMQAKAYFRLGSAQFEIGNFAEAARNFESSIKSTRAVSEHSEPEQVVLRRLAEANRENLRKSKQQRKKFKAMFAAEQHRSKRSSEQQADSDDLPARTESRRCARRRSSESSSTTAQDA